MSQSKFTRQGTTKMIQYPSMKNLIKKIQNTNHQEKLWERDSQIVLGISGGPDSVFLLEFFVKLKKKYNLNLIIAHVNYALRGKESEKDQELVEALAQKYFLEMFVLKPKLPKKISENYLRDVRYDFFEKIRQENNFDSIAVAHTMDDQVETFLMRVIRGAGMNGLQGMKYCSGKVIRPLLGISKKEILEYLKANKIKFRIDQTNLESKFLRNKIRNELIPYLEKNFNPNLKKTIFNSANSISEDYTLISELTKKNLMKDLSVKKLLSLHPALQKRILLEKIREKKPNLKDIESSHIAEILKAFKSTKGKNQVVLFQGLKVTRKSDKVVIV